MTALDIPVPLRWSDMDAYGHVNNVEFVRILEEARVLAFDRHAKETGHDVLATGVVVARHEIAYLRPLVHRIEPVMVRLWASHVGGASFDMQYEVLDSLEPGAARYAEAETTVVLYDMETGRPRRFTDHEREWVETMRDTPRPPKRRKHQEG